MPNPPVLIAQVSDLHIADVNELVEGVLDTAAALRNCVRQLNELAPQPDLVALSGDLTESGTDRQYANLRELLAPLRAPVAAIPGNHDTRQAMRRAFPHQPYALQDGSLTFKMSLSQLDVLLLDSTVSGQPYGLLESDCLRWLDEELSSSEDRPALIFLHHPPVLSGIDHMDGQGLRNADQLAEIVRKHPRIRLISAGHIHRAMYSQFEGRAYDDLPFAQSRRTPRPPRGPGGFHTRAAGVSSPRLVSPKAEWVTW